MMEESQTLRFEILRTDSLQIAMGGASGSAISFPDLPLVDAPDGRGYSKGLTRDQMSDRPYKPGMKLSEAMAIMAQFKASSHIDPTCVIFFWKKITTSVAPSNF